MTIQDLYDAIPNREDVDAVFINAVFVRLQNLKRLTEQAKTEPATHTELSREGNERTTLNPFWTVYRNEMAGVQQNLAELNLTPKTRKTIVENQKKRPKLN